MASRVRSTTVLTLAASVVNGSAYTDNRIVRLVGDVDCWVLIGNNAVADVSQFYMVAKVSREFDVCPGDRVSAIALGAGKLYVSDMSSAA